MGYSESPENTASFPSDFASSGESDPVTSRRNWSKSASTSLRVFPFIELVIRDADALEMAQPDPSKATS
jgi:hypothetical protein